MAIIDDFPNLSTPASGDEIPIERGTTVYKIDYNALATAILSKIGADGLSASPSLLINLASTAAANVMQAAPRPGVTGTLSPANGGTGQTSLQDVRNAMGLGDTLDALPVANGGTGQTSLQATRNAMGLGDTLDALPIPNGGTGATTAAAARTALGITPANIGAVPYSHISGTDLDTITTSGLYYCSGASCTTSGETGLTIHLIVVANSGNDRVLQIRVGISGASMMYRVLYNGWGAWKTLALA